MKAMIILNPSSGQEKAVDFPKQIDEALVVHYEERVLKETKGAGDAKKFAEEAIKENFDLVVSVGGDGTIHEVVNGLAPAEKRPALAIIPLGTVNDLARALDIPLKPEEAIELLKEFDLRKIDVGLASTEYFINSFALGMIPTAVHEVPIEEKSKLGPLAYAKEGVKEYFKNEKIQLTLHSDHFEWSGEANILMIGLTQYMAGLTNWFPEAKADDGVFHGLILKDLSLVNSLKLLPNLLGNNVEENEETVSFVGTEIRIEGKENYPSNLDGDKGIELPVTVKLLPSHLSIVVPK
ncbi:YegS//BmrU family lipid kinase [Enterococcus phoeniculicola]|jgi:diacylglycerol kinase (ATP)|uniref:YegS BmrU family lipid kinase n=1 Tax=Enterococcus phoeniculicola ATCC BAA-412 TaxID=1158610 RepID=R3WFE5_9ENTE|nr:diacylglycerol kinase family protein [Enterococcus phoeniculicola]EOL46187.1 YegS//BmrU family lipid kinase [Enterococcus phoeniculicola ATCC BAA-412]EOT76968.1 hypothetical protein I589_01929 [Enterococcus phoeniculicola ATCC BAA-412]OJG71180.1 YegS//BmrU family lipid kinase [Enterococcus phoeniculicola]